MSDDLRDSDLRELGRELPWAAPDAARTQAIRVAILTDARAIAAPRSRRPRWLGLGVAAAALAAAIVAAISFAGDRAARPQAATATATAPAPTDPPAVPSSVAPAPPLPARQRGTVQTSSAADFVHGAELAGGINDEVVRLRAGRVSVSVEPLHPDERFRVVAGDGEVEVRGTAFDVVVIADRLEAVTVAHGLVEVRLGGELIAQVAGGQHWTRAAGPAAFELTPPTAPARRPAATRAPAAIPAPPAAVTSADAPAPTDAAPAAAMNATPAPASAPAPAMNAMPAPAPPTPTERDFGAGRAALRTGDFGVAADLFADAIAADPRAPLAEDARYWRGVALARAGRDADGVAPLSDFLARHPTSLHAGRAALALGKLLLRAGDRAAARAHFDAARRDGDDAVRTAAEQAVRALER